MADSRQHDGPSLALFAALFVAVLFGGLAIGVALGGMMPLPYGSVAAVQQYVRTQPLAVQSHRGRGVRVVGAAGGLRRDGQCPAAPARRQPARRPTIALAGGILAAGALGLTGLLGWTLSRPEITGDTALVRSLYLLVFLVGGPGHIVALGVLVAGIAAGWPGCAAAAGTGWGGDRRAVRIDDAGVGLAGAGADVAGGTRRGVDVAVGGRRAAAASPMRVRDVTAFVRFRPAAFTPANIAVAWM